MRSGRSVKLSKQQLEHCGILGFFKQRVQEHREVLQIHLIRNEGLNVQFTPDSAFAHLPFYLIFVCKRRKRCNGLLATV